MLRGRLDQQSVFDALAWIDMTKSSGALRVSGADAGAIFFVDGLVYFAMVEGRKLTVDELRRAGITKEAWTAAGSRPEGDSSFAEKLVDAGTTPEAVRTFVWNRIIDVVSTFAELRTGEFSTAPGRHGFGSTVSFLVDDVVRAVRQGLDTTAPGYGSEATVSLKPAAVDVKITADDWNTLVSLIPPMTFGRLVEKTGSFSADRLVTSLSVDGLVEIAGPPGGNRRSEPPPPPPAVPSAPDERPDEPTGPGEPGRLGYDFGRAARSQPDPDLPDSFAVGRDTYAAMAGIRTTTTEHDTTTKTSALRRLIDVVRGL